MTRRTSTDFRALPMQVSAPQLGIDRELFDHEHLLRHLKLLNAICESWEKSKLGKPKPNADEKRLAAQAALNHISGAKAGVAGTYNRAAYAPEKRAALERWASHVQGLVCGQPANIVNMRKARGAT